jgi:hypothetical protein
MPYTIVLHIQNTDPVVGEVEQLPSPLDNMIVVNHPRRVDGKEISYLADNAVTVYWPIERINFVEVIAGSDDEDIIGFVRE